MPMCFFVSGRQVEISCLFGFLLPGGLQKTKLVI